MVTQIVGILLLRGLLKAAHRATGKLRPALARSPGGAAHAAPRENDERWLRLSSSNGIDSWLDFHTGEVSQWTAPEPPEPQGLMTLACAAFDAAKMRYHHSAQGGVFLLLGRDHARYVVTFAANDATRRLACITLFAATIPHDRHAETRELCERLNRLKGAGSFQLDAEDGTVFVQLSWIAPVDDVQPERIRDAVFQVCDLAEWAHDAFMRVAFGGQTADEVLDWQDEP